jgi:hypothetical protein
MHGIGHVIWFLAAWTPVKAGFLGGRWILPGNVTIGGPMGKIWGLMALPVVALFVAAAMALLTQSMTWRQLANSGVILSFAVVVPWIRQAPGRSAISAVIADLVLMILIALPLSVDLVSGG